MLALLETSLVDIDDDNNTSDPESIINIPYNTLIPNSKVSNIQYPVSFQNVRIEDSCICYNVKSDSCKVGMKYLQRIK
jgi:hypothetical protein